MRRTTLAERIAEMNVALSRPRYLRVVAEFLVHESAPPGAARCSCCRSVNATIAERIDAADLVIDLDTGDRITADDVDAATWSDLCGLAERHDLPLRCSRNQLPLLQDDTGRHIFASGGQRSGKTTCGLYWLAYQWLRRGGFQRRFWLVASTLPKSFRLLQKLLLGDADSPAILPRALVESMPSTHRASDTTTRFVDGSVIDLRYFDGDPSAERLKSDPILAAIVDEASHLPGEDSLIALRGRCMDHRGRLFFSSTPRPESFLKEKLVDKALEFERLPETDERKINRAHEGAPFKFAALPVTENPWQNQAEIAADLATLDLTRPAVRRDTFGEWIGSTGPLWLDYSPEKHLIVHEARDFAEMGPTYLAGLGLTNQVDITGTLVSRLFFNLNPAYRGIQATNKRYILGTDVNCHPMSTCILQVTGDKDAPEDKDKWHFWAIDVVRTAHGNSQAHVGQLKSAYFGKILEPGKSRPFDGCGVIIDAKALGRDPTVHKFGGDPRGIAELFGRAQFDARAPEYKSTEKGPVPIAPGRVDCFSLIHRLLTEGRLHISQRCESLHAAFVKQQDSGDGVTPEKNDPLDSAMDAFRYAVHAVMHAPKRETWSRLR